VGLDHREVHKDKEQAAHQLNERLGLVTPLPLLGAQLARRCRALP
jgi:hypothetical protein